jgi:hypothetical protein
MGRNSVKVEDGFGRTSIFKIEVGANRDQPSIYPPPLRLGARHSLIPRHGVAKLLEFGLTPSRTASWLSGKGGKRETTEYPSTSVRYCAPAWAQYVFGTGGKGETTEYLLNLGQIKTDHPLRLASG